MPLNFKTQIVLFHSKANVLNDSWTAHLGMVKVVNFMTVFLTTVKMHKTPKPKQNSDGWGLKYSVG